MQTFVLIFLDKYTIDPANTIIPMNPSSTPLNGQKPKNPPTPRMLNSPTAHEGHAGATILAITPAEPAPAALDICFFIKNTVIAITIPARMDVIINEMSEIFVNVPNDPIIRPPTNPNEKLLKISL